MNMNILGIVRTGVAMSLVAGLFAGCGGSYGGGGGSNSPASLTITVSPTAITVGQSATITWSSNGDSCTATGAWSGSKLGDGSETVTPAAAGTYTYSLTCRGDGYGDSNTGSATLTVTAAVASAMFLGNTCCIDSNAVAVTGLVSDAGAYRFLALGTHVIGSARKVPAVYEACGSCLAGRRLTDASAIERLDVMGGATVRGVLTVKDAAARPRQLEFAATRDRGVARAAGLALLQGTYSASLASGYTFTLAVDGSGEMNGADTHGCLVRGRAAPSRVAAGTFHLALTVSACGAANGHYRGSAALVGGDARRPAGLFLSASNRDAAIGWSLAR